MAFMIAAHDFPYIYHKLAESFLSWPWLWNAKDHDGLGVNTIGTLWAWPQELLFGMLTRLGLSWSIIALLFGVVLVIGLSWYSMGKLLRSYKLSKSAITLGRLIFILNTYILLLIDGGQMNLAVTYSLLPLAIYSINSTLLFATVILAISFLDIRIVYLIGLLVGIHFLFHFKKWAHYLVLGLITGSFLVGGHAYWLVPAVLGRAPELPTTYTRYTQVSNLSFANISHTLALDQPHWWRNVFGQTETTRWYFLVIPLIAFLPLVAYQKNKIVAYWSTVALVMVFLTKGSNLPFPQVYTWLFVHIPGWSLFRDPAKFFFLLALSYGVLWGFAVDYLQPKSKWLPIALAAYLLLLISPLYLGQMTGLFSRPRYASEYQALAKYLEQSPEGKIVWVPQKPPLGYSDLDHLSINATTLSLKRPFAVGVVGAYDTLNYFREATYSGQLLQAAGIRYIAFAPPDPLRDSQKPEDLSYRKLFPTQIAAQPWVEKRTDFGDVTLLELKDPQPLFYLANQTEFIVGPDSIYPTHSDLSQSALVFVEEQPGLLDRISHYKSANLRLNGSPSLASAAALAAMEEFVFPAQTLDFSPDQTRWWKRETADLISWRDFLAQKYGLVNQDFDYGGGWAVAEGEATLTINLPRCTSKCMLLVRSLSSSKGKTLEVATNHSLGKIPTRFNERDESSSATFSWWEAGEINSSDTQVTLRAEGNLNVVNALLVVDSKRWEELKQRANLLPTQSTHTNQQAEVKWIANNPSHYMVSVVGLIGPATLVFGQNYDPLWKLNDQSAIPVYSWLNGFAIPGDGTYTIHYQGQEHVATGLILSGLTLVLLIGVWTLKRRLKQLP